MKDYNQDLTDKNIRDLLKWRLLEQVEEDDLLTQKLMDMEAKLVFGTEAQIMPSLQKEKEILRRLNTPKNNTTFLKWLLPVLILTIIVALVYHYYSPAPQPAIQLNSPVSVTAKNNDAPEKSGAAASVAEAVPQTKKTLLLLHIADSVAADTLKPTADPQWKAASAGIKPDYNPAPHKPKFVDSDQSVPSLNEKEIEANNKLKEKLLKQVIKKDKSAWAYIPMGSDVFYGDTISMNGFYISTTEVTNKQYHVFLNDLLISGRQEDYLKAVPDTAKWLIDNKAFYEPMRKNYFWHPAYANYPVLNVSRAGAEMYCVWLTEEANKKIKNDHPDVKNPVDLYMNDARIPAESEWMMAARGGVVGNGNYPWGTDKIQNERGCFLCNFWITKAAADSAGGSCNLKGAPDPGVPDGLFFTGPVNVYNRNAYGLYCMAGNAAEMIYKDNWKEQMSTHKYKPGAPATKGGSWYSDADHVKVDAAAENVGVTEGSPYVGFRPVFTVKTTTPATK